MQDHPLRAQGVVLHTRGSLSAGRCAVAPAVPAAGATACLPLGAAGGPAERLRTPAPEAWRAAS